MKFAPKAAAPVAPSFTAKFNRSSVEKASATLNEDGSLDVTTEPGESVSLRPDPLSGELDSLVVVDENGSEEAIALPEPGQTVYSSSTEAPEDEAA